MLDTVSGTADTDAKSIKIICKSFGFKYGNDTDADIIFDVRCLPNPFYVAELKEKNGLCADVRNYVLSTEEGRAFAEKIKELLDSAIPLYRKADKGFVKVAFGCTGGRHRSVTFAETVCSYLKEKGYDCVTVHRDIQKG